MSKTIIEYFAKDFISKNVFEQSNILLTLSDAESFLNVYDDNIIKRMLLNFLEYFEYYNESFEYYNEDEHDEDDDEDEDEEKREMIEFYEEEYLPHLIKMVSKMSKKEIIDKIIETVKNMEYSVSFSTKMPRTAAEAYSIYSHEGYDFSFTISVFSKKNNEKLFEIVFSENKYFAYSNNDVDEINSNQKIKVFKNANNKEIEKICKFLYKCNSILIDLSGSIDEENEEHYEELINEKLLSIMDDIMDNINNHTNV